MVGRGLKVKQVTSVSMYHRHAFIILKILIAVGASFARPYRGVV